LDGSQETPIEAHEEVIRARLIGDAHAVLPTFLKQSQGIFVNMISLGGIAAAPFAVPAAQASLARLAS
jgi:short-subunit dehydrogenase